MFYIIHVVTKVKLYLKSYDKKQNPDNYKRVNYKYQIPSQIFGNLFFNITVTCIRHFTDQFIL